MTESREIRVRLPFRILAGLVCAGLIGMWVRDPSRAYDMWVQDTYNLISLLVVFPLFVSATVSGRMPDFIARNLHAALLDDFQHAETLFTQFNARSVAAALVFFSMVFYGIHRTLG